MLFDTLEIPEPLLIAQKEGRLVVFAGAGVSVDAPSKLPGFAGLTEQIAGRKLKPRERLRLDHLLGELNAEGLNVHAEAARILSRPDSAPTQLHRDLVRLFSSGEHVRLVTTNFDSHFRTEVQSRFPGTPVFTAPALPRGGDFSGLVEMHGCIRGVVSDLVVTDRDFGRAYLTEGWARTFVEQMFTRYTVLFVGYSLTDPPLHYLARGLPTEDMPRRYVITREDPARWKMLGVRVIPFRTRSGQRRFTPLNRGIASWVEVTRGSNFALEERIVAILERPDPGALPAEDAELLVWSLNQDDTVNYFTRNARGLAWVEWLARRGLLRPYFDPRTEFTHPRQRQIAVWLANELTAKPEEKDRALGIVHAQGGRFAREFYFWLRHRMDDANVADEWTMLLAGQVDVRDTDALWAFGMRLRALANVDSPLFWPLWSFLTTPEVELDPIGLDPADGAQVRIAVKGLAGDLWSSWNEVVQVRLDRTGQRMLTHLLEKWERAVELAHGLNAMETLHRRATDSRRRIAARDYHHHRGHEPSVLVDMLVKVIGYLARQTGQLSAVRITAWLDSDDSVFRRLGLHALLHSVDVPVADKPDWVRLRIAAYTAGTPEQHEAQDLLRELSAAPQSIPQTNLLPATPPVSEALPPVAELLRMTPEAFRNAFRFVRLSPAVILAALRDLDAETVADPAHLTHPLWERLLSYNAWRDLDANERDQLLAVVQRRDLVARYPSSVLRCLFQGDPLEAEGAAAATSAQVGSLFSLSHDVWRQLAPTSGTEEPTDYVGTDWISLALSHGIYHLVQFWLRYLALQPVNTSAPVLPAALATIFEDVATRNTGTGRRARAVLLQDVGFLIVRDPEWTKRHLIPLFDFAAHDENAWIAWRPLLEHGRFNRLLAVAITPAYRVARARIFGAGERLAGEYLQDAARIMVHVDAPEITGWPEELLVALDEPDRLRWARLVGRELPGMTDEQQAKLWERWLGNYWEQRSRARLGTRTLRLTPREAAVMVAWLPALPAGFPRAFELARVPPQLDFQEERFDWRDLRRSTVPTRHPTEFLAFVEFLLRNMQGARVHHESLQETLARLPRLSAFREPLLRIAEVFQQHGWLQARPFRSWVEQEFPPPDYATEIADQVVHKIL